MKNQIIDMEQMRQSRALLNKIYDAVRIVHPLRKQVLNFDGEKPEKKVFHCFNLWGQGKMCSNCISIRTYMQKKIHFKLEHIEGKIYLVMAVPVQEDGELFVLELIKDITYNLTVESFSEDKDYPLLKLLNDMGELQIRDALTGMLNRRYINERLPVDMHNCSKDAKPLSIILADIDHFKRVNDTYGHVAGDHVLKEFAQLLQANTPKVGWVARYGGEEFLISLFNADLNEAEMLAERLRSKVESSQFVYDNNVIRITSSFGVCTLGHTREIAVEALIECVDKNLYQAKNGGRNQVVASRIE
ncbi:MAG: GGDEF domain-containing protein [Clostridia bacterium]|nr:GGDEF domain-containing protein [Clostridia bacterium]